LLSTRRTWSAASRDIELFQLALELVPPWMLVAADFDAEKNQRDIELDFKTGGHRSLRNLIAVICLIAGQIDLKLATKAGERPRQPPSAHTRFEEMKVSKFGEWIAATVGETLTYHAFPCAHWHRIRTQHFTRCCEAAIPTLPPAARGQSAAASTIRSFAHGRGVEPKPWSAPRHCALPIIEGSKTASGTGRSERETVK
jgi:hypothetical protein